MKKTTGLLLLAVLACCGAPGAASAATPCEALRITRPVARGLRGAFLQSSSAYRRGGAQLVRSGFAAPSYGRCGKRFYAIAMFRATNPDISDRDAVYYQDQPHTFFRRSGRGWKDTGDTGGYIACSQFPRALLTAWHRDCFDRDGKLRRN